KIEHKGGDKTAPTGTPPAGTSNIDACFIDATTVPAGTPAFDPIKAAKGYSDNCGGPVTAILTGTTVTGDDCAWTVTYTFKVADACNNELTGQKIEHKGGDKTPPVMKMNTTCVYLTEYGKWTLVDLDKNTITKEVTDNCSDFKDLYFNFSPKSFDCNDAAKYNPVVVTATDLCNNTSTSNATVLVLDTIRPVAICRDVTRYLDQFGQTFLIPQDVNNSNIKSKFEWAIYFNLLNGGSYDNCGISEMYLDKQLFTSADTGKNTVVLSVFDPSKNIDVCTAVVTVIDTFQSVLEPIDPVVKIVPPGPCTTKINYPQIKVRGNLNVTLVQMAGLGATGDFPLGTTLETWKATDEKGKVSYTSFTVTIKTYNAAPVIEAPADLTINEDAAPFEIPLSGIGFGNDCKPQLLDLTLVNGNEGLLMADMTYVKGSSSGKIMITPKAKKNGEAVITLTLMDDGGTENGGIDKVVKGFKITVKPVNDVPEVVPIPDQYIILPGTLSVNVATAFKDYDDGDVLTITLTRQDGTALPSWMTFNPSTGMLIGTPTTANTGNIWLKATATDKAGASVSDIFLVTVIEPNTATLNVSAAKGASPLTGGFVVLLYVKQGAMFNLLNFTPVFSSGTYTYNNLPYGTYLAKAVITDAAMNPGLLHTYYESSTSVTGATEVILDNTLPLTIQVKMVASTLPAGEYKIMGKVVKKTGTPDLIAQGLDPVATPAPGIDLVLKQNGLVVANTVTGLNGTYEFTGLAAGVYDVFAEVPGYTQTITQKVTLSTTTPVKDKVDFTIWTSSTTFVITSVQHVESAFTFNLYPNPTTGKVFVDLTWNGLRTADLTVYSILGVQVFRKEYHSGEQITFDMSGQVTGVYMVKVNAEGRTYVKKLILDRK
ncbi:MAG TPA: putative Ig domain-containing protein, partial [Prolixibacteraceae bacterium]|nr:putative Ig domain-containing protein [Prolixibacteraceae bacterium]